MTTEQMIEACKKNAFDNNGLYGHSVFQNVRADFTPTSSRTTLAKFKGRINWTVDGKRSTKNEVKALIG